MKLELLEHFIKAIIAEALEDEIEDRIQELMEQPEFTSIVAFVEAKYEDEEETYGVEELQALARNIFLKDNPNLHMRKVFAPQGVRDRVKRELEGYGLKFIPRKTEKQVRGFTAPVHGSNRYAGNHGGSGFEGLRGGHSANTTPSSKRIYNASGADALPMGSRRK